MNIGDEVTVIQRITTSWTKNSRGAPGAIRRNAIPVAFRIPLEKCRRDGHALIEHLLGFYEYRNFEDRSPITRGETFELGETIRHGCVLIQKNENRLQVNWTYTPQDAGIPFRPPKKNDLFDLRLNQWCRIIYNGRYSEWEGGWWYQKTVLNVGLFESPDATVFIETEPNVVLDKLAKLY